MKRLISILLKLVFVLTISFNYITAESNIENNSSYLETEINNVIKNQAMAVEAYQVLLDSFQTDDNGKTIYPDSYAGEYIEDNKLVLLLSNIDEVNLSYYKNILNGFNCIEYRYAEHSLNYLDEQSQTIVNKMRNLNITEYYIDRKENKIVIGTTETQKAKNTLMKSSISNLVLLINEEGIEEETDVIGGDKITNSNESKMLKFSW